MSAVPHIGPCRPNAGAAFRPKSSIWCEIGNCGRKRTPRSGTPNPRRCDLYLVGAAATDESSSGRLCSANRRPLHGALSRSRWWWWWCAWWPLFAAGGRCLRLVVAVCGWWSQELRLPDRSWAGRLLRGPSCRWMETHPVHTAFPWSHRPGSRQSRQGTPERTWDWRPVSASVRRPHRTSTSAAGLRPQLPARPYGALGCATCPGAGQLDA